MTVALCDPINTYQGDG